MLPGADLSTRRASAKVRHSDSPEGFSPSSCKVTPLARLPKAPHPGGADPEGWL